MVEGYSDRLTMRRMSPHQPYGTLKQSLAASEAHLQDGGQSLHTVRVDEGVLEPNEHANSTRVSFYL